MSSNNTKDRPKKKKRPSVTVIQEAVKEVIEYGHSINSIALARNISRTYLARIVNRAKESDNPYVHCPNIGNRRIFTLQQENDLEDYLKITSKMCHGLSYKQTRNLAFQYAETLSVTPDKWKSNKEASIDWLQGFMKRHKSLTIRKPEATSLSRATSFNKTNVKMFFDKLTALMTKYKFPPHLIFNLDETGCSTVTTPPKVIAQRGTKQVGQVTSAERGNLVTVLFMINASGSSLPPVFIFPRVHYKDIMLVNGPVGALGLANSSGWMNEECFVSALQHFMKYVNPTEENPMLILMDNHCTHVNVSVIEFARKNHIIILTFPPHCSHRLQPLDVAVFAPFKSRYKIVMNEWMLSNPGVTVTIYHVGQFVKEAFLTSFTPHNLTQGFAKTGIYPLNSNIFSNEDFLPSYITDRSLPTESDSQQQSEEQSNIVEVTYIHVTQDPTHVTEESESSPQLSTSTKNIVPLERIRPFPKAGPRKKVIRLKAVGLWLSKNENKKELKPKRAKEKGKKKKLGNIEKQNMESPFMKQL
ncbi:PREDICTED: uncharacterized protein LOC108757511 [Trachymyrmex cornetzi]|uniref:uncharacterized protein LOC108757511 n=1 Tax=Trachymyrmex cornetzi TaxID=471704 RepID=UPI00084EF34C|nr:PREDICTED: uncharacterized protein LOC108757511 [Trachymyrmex cornetzi]